jgi:hypothetical protein
VDRLGHRDLRLRAQRRRLDLAEPMTPRRGSLRGSASRSSSSFEVYKR